MFGPHICGYCTKKVHAILTFNGTNHLIKRGAPCETDRLTHVCIFVLWPDASYSILVDSVEKQSGSLYSGIFSHQRRSRIQRPRSPKIGMTRSTFLNLKKPKDYDDIPKELPDPDAKKLRTGMMRKMVNGHHQQLPTPNTRIHGSRRKLRTPTTRANGRLQKLIIQYCLLQR
ncbi:calreticulin-1-like [Olea europaea var. sylvestris]|uniref:calreticulin-1-like n=1 Tax=Olea europaea var. sylvestris TaxID=158386 RepID=UPI000C1D2CDD|nr:calreticulin-1-like [Olea europaea var. sylvestris]XP_022889357.1 calreticulin-1-like [Olea europaea var. sylvestris]